MGVAGEYRLAVAMALSCLACGRIGFDNSAIDEGDSSGESEVDAGAATVDASPPAPDARPLVTGCVDDDGSDIDFDGIPDACDPCVSADKMTDPCAADNGVPTLALLPSWSEKAFHMALNIARADHVGFRDEYMTFSDKSASEVFSDSPAARSSLHYRQLSAEGGRMHTASFVNCETTPGSF